MDINNINPCGFRRPRSVQYCDRARSPSPRLEDEAVMRSKPPLCREVKHLCPESAPQTPPNEPEQSEGEGVLLLKTRDFPVEKNLF